MNSKGFGRRTLLVGGVGGALAAAARLGPVGCVLDQPLKLPIDYEPESTGDGLGVGSAAEVGLDPTALEAVYERFFSEDEFITGRSFLVMKRGLLVGEGYVRARRDRERLSHVKSVSKSLTSIIVGQALDRGRLDGLELRLGEVLDEAAHRGGPYAEISLLRLLEMRSGLDWDNAEDTGELMVEEPEDSVRFVLKRDVVRPPTQPHYADADPHLVAAVLGRVAGRPLDSLARDWLFDPLGIANFRWERARDGISYGAFGAWLRPRDMLRIGELMRQGGRSSGAEIVPESWVSESTRAKVELEDGPYAHYWWPRDDLSPGTFVADGHGGQYIAVVPAHELVCVQTAEPYTPTHEAGIIFDETAELIKLLIEGSR